MKPETRAIHAGERPDPETGAVIPPLYMTTTYERAIDGDYPTGLKYSRNGNPNRHILEERLAQLEGGARGFAFASGSAAAMSMLQTLQTGDHIIVPDDFYYGIQLIIRDIFSVWGLQATFVDMTDLDAVRDAMQANTRLVLTETPSNPMINITDIAAIAEIAHAGGAYLVTDNTIPTAVLQQPFQHGADFVLLSTTKYLAGHHDVIGGAIVAREAHDLVERLAMIQEISGAIPSPFDCWLVMRGLQTLPYRVRAHAANALTVARYLADQPQVERVLYPDLDTHPQYDIAQRQMETGGGLMSVQIAGDEAQAMAFVARLKLITRATSFGGTHSLIEHRASMEHDGTRTPRNLLRLSIGLEHPDDLIADLGQALADI